MKKFSKFAGWVLVGALLLIYAVLYFSGNTDPSPSVRTSVQEYQQSGFANSLYSVQDKENCVIKGNISYKTGEKIYHLPSDAYYDRTVINEAYGERWLCTEAEARAAGWRHTYR
ncbi:MAG: hypothetical protein AAB539_00610 [Patescibacteria group bacterium]